MLVPTPFMEIAVDIKEKDNGVCVPTSPGRGTQPFLWQLFWQLATEIAARYNMCCFTPHSCWALTSPALLKRKKKLPTGERKWKRRWIQGSEGQKCIDWERKGKNPWKTGEGRGETWAGVGGCSRAQVDMEKGWRGCGKEQKVLHMGGVRGSGQRLRGILNSLVLLGNSLENRQFSLSVHGTLIEKDQERNYW